MKFSFDSSEDFLDSSEPLIFSSESQSKSLDKIESPLFIPPISSEPIFSTIQKKQLFIVEKNKTSFVTFKPKKSKSRQKSNHKLITKGRWTKEERIKFAFALYKFGTDWKKIKAHIKTRSFIQLRSHGQKFLAKLKTNKIIVEKGLNLDNYNWKESVDCLKENLSEEEFMNVLYSIESEMGDNNRMTERYLERKRLRLKMNLNRTEETLNTCFNSSDENNLNLFENKLKEDLQNNIDENNNHSNIIDLEEENNYKNNLYKYNFYVNKNLVSNIFKKELSKIDENIFNLEEDNLLYKSKSDTLKALYKL